MVSCWCYSECLGLMKQLWREWTWLHFSHYCWIVNRLKWFKVNAYYWWGDDYEWNKHWLWFETILSANLIWLCQRIHILCYVSLWILLYFEIKHLILLGFVKLYYLFFKHVYSAPIYKQVEHGKLTCTHTLISHGEGLV